MEIVCVWFILYSVLYCNNPVALTYSVLAHWMHGWQHRCQEDSVSLSSGGLEKTTRTSPRHVGTSPSNRIWDTTTLCSPKQQIWLGTALCGRWCWCMVLCSLRVACASVSSDLKALYKSVIIIIIYARNDDDGLYLLNICLKNSFAITSAECAKQFAETNPCVIKSHCGHWTTRLHCAGEDLTVSCNNIETM